LHHRWISINGREFYFKAMFVPGYSELICSELAKMLGLDAVEYDLAILENHKGVISRSYQKPGCEYITGHELLRTYYTMNYDTVNNMGLSDIEWENGAEQPWYFHMNNLMTIWQALEFNFPDADIKPVMNKIVDKFIFMILTEQYDQGAQNWEVEINRDKIDLVPIYDNESGFSGVNEEYGMVMSFSTDFSDTQGFIAEVLKRFLKISSDEYINRFIEMFNAMDENMFNKAIANVEKKIGVKIPSSNLEEIKENYLKNRTKIMNVLEELNLNKGR